MNVTTSGPPSLLASDPIRLSIPTCEHGIGTVVTGPDGGGLIDGIVIDTVTVWPDDRGYFFEVARIGRGLIEHFPIDRIQVSATFSYPGTIKAFHYHVHQADCWIPSMGMMQVALIDFRESSPTFGAKNTLYIGDLRPWRVLIPPGVAHGYKVIGQQSAGLIYVTSGHYDPTDEGRVAYNDPRLNYDWALQIK